MPAFVPTPKSLLLLLHLLMPPLPPQLCPKPLCQGSEACHGHPPPPATLKHLDRNHCPQENPDVTTGSAPSFPSSPDSEGFHTLHHAILKSPLSYCFTGKKTELLRGEVICTRSRRMWSSRNRTGTQSSNSQVHSLYPKDPKWAVLPPSGFQVEEMRTHIV